jgi:hypothetical protein
MCPKCRAKKFDSPPLYTYEEKVARKRERLQQQAQIYDTVQHGGERAGEMASIRKNSGHGLLPEDRRGFDSPTVSTSLPHSVLTRQVSLENDSIQNVTLSPPPVPGTINSQPLSLRERLAYMKMQPVAVAATTEPIPAPKDVVTEASDDELVEAINGEDDAT